MMCLQSGSRSKVLAVKRKCIIPLFLAVGYAGMAMAGLGDPRPAVWTLTPIPGSSNLQISVQCFGFETVTVAEGSALRIPGQATAGKPGAPDVPGLAKLVPGIKGMRAVLTLQGFDPTNLMDVVVAPVESPVQGSLPQRQSDPGIYGKAQFWPSKLGWVDEAWIGTQKVVRLECHPVQYNPVQKSIRFYRRLEGIVSFEKMDNIPSP